MLTRLRQAISPIVTAMGAALGDIVPSPNFWTLVGLLLSLAAAFFFALNESRPAALLVLASGFMDVVDGAVARAKGRVTKRGGFLDSNMDRVGESALYLGLIFSFSKGIYTFVAGLALASSLLVSYSRARAEAAGLKAEGVGVGERAERLLVLAAGGLIGGVYLYYAVVIVAALSLLTFLQRVYVYGSKLT